MRGKLFCLTIYGCVIVLLLCYLLSVLQTVEFFYEHIFNLTKLSKLEYLENINDPFSLPRRKRFRLR